MSKLESDLLSMTSDEDLTGTLTILFTQGKIAIIAKLNNKQQQNKATFS